MIPRLLFFSLVSLTSLLVLPTDAAAEGRTVQLLTIGNSFSRNATNHLDDLARAAGQTLIDRPIVVGGASLELHATKAQRHETDPAGNAGLYANGRCLMDELTAEKWDYVTIQQASIKSHDLTTYRPFAKWLSDCIAQNAPGCSCISPGPTGSTIRVSRNPPARRESRPHRRKCTSD